MNTRILLAGHENKDADRKFVNYFKDSVKLGIFYAEWATIEEKLGAPK